MFFKGVGGILNSAAEYQEEMGVLKQISRVPITDKNGKDYTITIKLSPVKNKDNFYYVEAETNAPGLDVSSINDKTMRLDNTSMKSFNAMIDKLLEENGLQVDEEAQDTQLEEETAEDDSTMSTEAQIDELIASYNNEAEPQTVSADTEWYDIISTASKGENPNTIALTVGVAEVNSSQFVDKFLQETEEINAVDENGKVISIEMLLNQANTIISDFMTNHGMKVAKTSPTNASTRIQATFANTEHGVELTAINASCNINTALDIVDELADTDEFIEMLTEEPQSFEIVPEDGEFTIAPIDDINVSEVYDTLFECASYVASTIQAYRWALGETNWYRISFLESIGYTVLEIPQHIAQWVIQHTDHYPVPMCNLTPFSQLTEIKDNNGKINSSILCDVVYNMLCDLVDVLSGYYVNLETAEQSQVDNWVSTLNDNLSCFERTEIVI